MIYGIIDKFFFEKMLVQLAVKKKNVYIKIQ